MAKKREIQAVSLVHINGEVVNTDHLDDSQRRRLATWLKTTYLNALFQGKAEFFERGGGGEREESPDKHLHPSGPGFTEGS